MYAYVTVLHSCVQGPYKLTNSNITLLYSLVDRSIYRLFLQP